MKIGRWPLGLESCDLGKSSFSGVAGEKPNRCRREAVRGAEEMEAVNGDSWKRNLGCRRMGSRGGTERETQGMGFREGFILIVHLAAMEGLGSTEKL